MRPSDRLREILARPGLVEAPGCYDALSARLVERAGFEVGYVTGFGAAASRLGAPDTGLLSFKEMLDHVASLAAAVSIPLVADADTGYGNAMNVARTVRDFARAGAAAVQIEDQAWPKRCGHTAGKQVIPRAEMVGKIRAALDARGADGLLVIARTDARAVAGMDDAIERCRAFAEAGADLVFLEAPESRAELERIPRSVAAPLVVNLIEGGRTPLLPAAELAAMGYKLAIRPLTLLFAAAGAVRAHLDARPLRPWHGPPTFDEIREIVGWPEYDARLARYRG